MSHFASRWSLVLVAALASASLVRAQDPIPIAYWSHPSQPHWGAPPVNAFAMSRAPMPQVPMPHAQMPHAQMQSHYPVYPAAYPGPQLAVAPQGGPEAGVRTRFIIPACAPNCHHGHGRPHPFLHSLFHPNINFNFHLRAPLVHDSLPTHPYARSPRDFFMFHENLEAERSRDLRPAIVP
jgi:hypothetical protein